MDAGDGGRTSRVTLNQVRGSLFPQGIPEGEKGDKGQRGTMEHPSLVKKVTKEIM